MIRPDKLVNALYSMQLVVIQVRFLVLTEDLEEKSKIVGLLDFLDDAPRMIASFPDETDQFRWRLEVLAERCGYSEILLRFDNAVPSKW